MIEIRPLALALLCFGTAFLFLVMGFGVPLLRPEPSALDEGLHVLALLAVIPFALALLLLRTRRLTFDRATGSVSISSTGILGRRERRFALHDLQGATLAHSRSADGSRASFRAILHFPDGQVPASPFYSSGSGPSRTVTAINDWLGPEMAERIAGLPTGDDRGERIRAGLARLGLWRARGKAPD